MAYDFFLREGAQSYGASACHGSGYSSLMAFDGHVVAFVDTNNFLETLSSPDNIHQGLPDPADQANQVSSFHFPVFFQSLENPMVGNAKMLFFLPEADKSKGWNFLRVARAAGAGVSSTYL